MLKIPEAVTNFEAFKPWIDPADLEKIPGISLSSEVEAQLPRLMRGTTAEANEWKRARSDSNHTPIT